MKTEIGVDRKHVGMRMVGELQIGLYDTDVEIEPSPEVWRVYPGREFSILFDLNCELYTGLEGFQVLVEVLDFICSRHLLFIVVLIHSFAYVGRQDDQWLSGVQVVGSLTEGWQRWN